MLGSRARLQWAELDIGIAAMLASWGNYVFHLHNSQLDALMCRGFTSMFDGIQSSLGNFLSNWSPSFVHVWCGYFTPLGVILGVKGTMSQGDYYYFDIHGEGRLWKACVESTIWQTTSQSAVKVVGMSSKSWIFRSFSF